MGILNRWRQFGRRYFWPHLLLGMVAASLGLPTSLNETNEHASASNATASISRQNPVAFSLTELASLKEVHRRTSFGIDYWHQHAICTIIRHLSFALTVPQAHALPEAEAALSAHPLVILDTLNALLTLPETPSALQPFTAWHPGFCRFSSPYRAVVVSSPWHPCRASSLCLTRRFTRVFLAYNDEHGQCHCSEYKREYCFFSPISGLR